MKNHDIRPYEEIPEETREYSDFIVKISLLGDELGPVSCLEDRRIALHKAMAARYGLEYESTRGAVAMLEIGFRDVTNEKHVAMVLDQRMRNLKESSKSRLT